jgi:hypothetical protein
LQLESLLWVWFWRSAMRPMQRREGAADFVAERDFAVAPVFAVAHFAVAHFAVAASGVVFVAAFL